jgi:uncharacterized membrane protein YbhN (UPF0104 family)
LPVGLSSARTLTPSVSNTATHETVRNIVLAPHFIGQTLIRVYGTIDGMQVKRRRWWPVVKALVGLVIIFYIGRGFARDLAREELWEQPLHLSWLVPAAVLYLLAFSVCALYWRRLLVHLGQQPPVVATLRAYFIGQLGKYVPGKALALLLRAFLIRRSGVSAGLAGMTAFYEVLVTMAGGAVVAALLFLALAGFAPGIPNSAAWRQLWLTFLDALRDKTVPSAPPHPGTIVVISAGLSALLLAPIVPRFFNRMAIRLSLPFRHQSGAPPPIRLSYLLEGLLLTSLTWPMLGSGLALALQAIPGAEPSWDIRTLVHLTAVMALSYVAGFTVLIAPGAMGVREVFLVLLLTPDLMARGNLTPGEARGKVVLAVLLLRLAWTVAEVVISAVLYQIRVEIRTNEPKIAPEGQLLLHATESGGCG